MSGRQYLDQITVNGSTFFGAPAADPPTSDSSDGDTYWNTAIKQVMVFFGAPRNKWLSSAPTNVQSGTFASAGPGVFLFAPVFSSMSTTKGVPVPKGTLISVRADKANALAVDMEILISGALIHTVNMAGATINDTTVNADIGAPGLLAIRTAAGSPNPFLNGTFYLQIRERT